MITVKNIMRFTGVILLATIMVNCSNKSDSQSDDVVVVKENGKTMKINVEDGIPTVIDFYATWCGPCKEIAPVYEALKEKYGDKVNFLTVDIDEQPDIANDYNINAVPTFVFLNDSGSEIYRIKGYSPDQLTDMVSQLADY